MLPGISSSWLRRGVAALAVFLVSGLAEGPPEAVAQARVPAPELQGVAWLGTDAPITLRALRGKNINVNCVLPTILDTPENRASMPDADPARWVAPQDLANVIAFLCSDAARAVHGAASTAVPIIESRVTSPAS